MISHNSYNIDLDALIEYTRKQLRHSLPPDLNHNINKATLILLCELKDKREQEKKQKQETASEALARHVSPWYGKANSVDLGDLQDFIKGLCFNHKHSIESRAHAMAAGAIAGMMTTCNNIPGLGVLTNDEASVVARLFIKHCLNLKGHVDLIKYEDMLYPQYEYKFPDKTISPEVYEWLKQEASRLYGTKSGIPEVRDHWADIIGGKVPFGYKVR